MFQNFIFFKIILIIAQTRIDFIQFLLYLPHATYTIYERRHAKFKYSSSSDPVCPFWEY